MATVPMQNINEHYHLLDLVHIRNFRLPIIFVLGGPGAGKASLCYQFRSHYGISYLSIGTLLRQEANEPTVRGRAIAAYINEMPAKKVPTDLVLQVLKDNLVKVVAANRPVFIQGYPRDFEQAAKYEDEVAPIRHVLFLNTSEETSKRRLLQRNKLAARFEDSSQIIHQRRETFRREVLPVIDNLRITHRVKEINGNNALEVVYNDARMIFGFWTHRGKIQYLPKGAREETDPRLKFGSQEKRILTKAEADIEKHFPSVHYHGPIYDGHY
ncbi:putative Adenylate kinase isoenzyme 1 [Hypsibius exemplaris]|uniref:Adenylate kinase isoenzyme 1 n=1 Tax=Hypsibius exemplaris TaxID=2072580 RepID=A0A1W0XBV5_HYPEX|nr:putative Adenylate kinase isoenzyme 1 [Hypsibius exemplaris]